MSLRPGYIVLVLLALVGSVGFLSKRRYLRYGVVLVLLAASTSCLLAIRLTARALLVNRSAQGLWTPEYAAGLTAMQGVAEMYAVFLMVCVIALAAIALRAVARDRAGVPQRTAATMRPATYGK
jgi:hypothetical protein